MSNPRWSSLLRIVRAVALTFVAGVVGYCLTAPNCIAQDASGAGATAVRQAARDEMRLGLQLVSRTGGAVEARKHFSAAARLDPTYPAPFYNLAIVDAAEEKWDAAIESLQTVVRLDPAGGLGRSARDKLATLQAIKAYDEEHGRAARQYETLVVRARTLLSAKLYKSALAEAGNAAKLNDKRPEAYLVAAGALEASGSYKRAVSFLQEVLKRTTTENAQSVLAAISKLSGRTDQNDSAATATPTSSASAAAAAVDLKRLLTDLTAWDAATSAQRRAAAEAVARRETAFTLVRLERFAAGGASHEVAIFTHTATGMGFVLVPAGTFEMGSPASEAGRYANETQHQVTLTQPFLIARRDCTQAVYEFVTGVNPSKFKGANLPVEQVSWDEAKGFCGKEGLELPTEAQWEYACRAGTRTAWSTGDTPTSLEGFANIYDAYAKDHMSEIPYDTSKWTWKPTTEVNDGFATTSPVGSFKPNAFGLYDMHGSVWEWCADWYGDYPTGAVTEPTGAAGAASRVIRGGSWGDPAGFARSAYRGLNVPGARYAFLGFRPARLVATE